MNTRIAVILCILLATAISSAWGAILRKDVVVFSVDKKNRAVATITSGPENQAKISRTYHLPYLGGKGLTWRKKDIAIYQIDCKTKQVALMQLSITAKQEKEVFKAIEPDWKPASGPDLYAAFMRICEVAVPKTPVMYPDEWLSPVEPALDLSHTSIFLPRFSLAKYTNSDKSWCIPFPRLLPYLS